MGSRLSPVGGGWWLFVIAIQPHLGAGWSPILGKYEKLLRKILEGRADAAISFRDIRRLLLRLGFVETIRGSHHLFRHPDLGLLVNLQSAGAMAKPYQVKQVRIAIMNLQKESRD